MVRLKSNLFQRRSQELEFELTFLAPKSNFFFSFASNGSQYIHQILRNAKKKNAHEELKWHSSSWMCFGFNPSCWMLQRHPICGSQSPRCPSSPHTRDPASWYSCSNIPPYTLYQDWSVQPIKYSRCNNMWLQNLGHSLWENLATMWSGYWSSPIRRTMWWEIANSHGNKPSWKQFLQQHSSLRVTAVPPYILITTSWDILDQSPQLICSQIPYRNCEIIHLLF